MAGLYDGLGGEELQTSGTGYQAGSALSPYFAGSVTSESQFSGLNLYATGSVDGNRVLENGTLRLPAVGIGSPTDYTSQVQILGGSGASDAGSDAVVAFSTPFSVTPSITLGVKAGDGTVHYTDQGTGSFSVITEDASREFTWIALGER